MNALEERRERVAYAKSLGVDKPHTLKKDALEDAIREAEAAKTVDPTDPTTGTDTDEDPFDEIDPSVEGDHMDTDATIADKVAERDATREAWLLAGVELLRPLLKQAGAVVPERIAVSVGFPSRNARKTLGVCFPTAATSEGWSHLFISPLLENAVEVLGVLAHELIHASDDCASKHGGHFRQCALALGLTGKMTATTIGDDLRPTLEDMAGELGKYPHVKINLSGVKKQTTRLLKGVCSDGECPLADEKGNRYTIRLTQKWVEVGMPSCPCGAEMLLEEG